jgi:L-fuculose-phosphate aldolase
LDSIAETTEMGEKALRVELVRVCRKLADAGLIAATDGNISCRAGEDCLLITPGGTRKEELEPADLLLVDLQGDVLAGRGKPSSEVRMHLLVYQKRPDVQAAVHAHPPMLTAFTVSGIPFTAEALPEVWLTIGPIAVAPYATPCTEEVPDSIAPFIEKHEAILLERHGSLTLGGSLKQAYMRLEKLEHAAHILFYARLLGQRHPTPLSADALEKLGQLKQG